MQARYRDNSTKIPELGLYLANNIGVTPINR